MNNRFSIYLVIAVVAALLVQPAPTAAEIGATDYYNVHGPKRLKDTITLAQSEFKNIQLTSQAKQMAAAMNLNTGAVASSGGSTHSVASELEKLYQLKLQGVLTEEEYLKAKSRLLNF